jgi:hypothetical protein
MTRLVQLVAGYGPGDLAYAEFTQRLALAVPDAVVHLTRVAPRDTLATAFCVAELALTEGPPDRIVAHDAGGGSRMCGGRTRDGAWIVGADAGWSWSFVINELSSLCRLDASQLALAIVHVAKGHPHAVCDPVPRESVPPVPERVVAYVDSAGNVKTTIAEPPAPAGTRINVRIGGASAQVLVAGAEAIRHGELALSAGPGWPSRRGGRRCFFELVVSGGSASDRFADPAPGTAVHLSP